MAVAFKADDLVELLDHGLLEDGRQHRPEVVADLAEAQSEIHCLTEIES